MPVVGLGWSLLLFLSSASANDFALSETSARFQLRIRPGMVQYSSENLRQTFSLNPCSRKLALTLNTELFYLLPRKPLAQGLAFRFDQKAMLIDPKGPLAAYALGMDQRMMVFADAEKKCQGKPN